MRTGRALIWVVAAVAVGGMVLAELSKPVAPPVTPAVASSYLDAATIAAAERFREPLRLAGLAGVLLRAGTAAAALWWVARRGDRWRPTGRARLVAVGAAGAALWALTDLVRLPLAVWAWRRSVDVGLSTRDLGGWAYDYAIQAVPYWIGVGLTVIAVAWLHERAPRVSGPLAGLVGGVVGGVLIVVSPLVFEPLLLRFTPLPDQPLRTAVAQAAEAAGVGADVPVLVADASRRTTASNAYVSGLGTTRRIVLYDTLLRDAPDDEVLAVVGHELGHDLNRDLERTALQLIGVTTLLAVIVWALLGARVVDGSGRVTPSGGVRAVAVMVLLLVVLGPVERWSSRRTESAADAAALELTGDPDGYRDMMVGLARRNLTDPDPPAWSVVLFASHPPVGERIARTRLHG